jgi:hypothetical protein
MLAALAVNAVFTVRGTVATYSPPSSGGSLACVVIYDAGDREAANTLGRPFMRTGIIRVRK